MAGSGAWRNRNEKQVEALPGGRVHYGRKPKYAGRQDSPAGITSDGVRPTWQFPGIPESVITVRRQRLTNGRHIFVKVKFL